MHEPTSREGRILAAFVSLTDTLVRGFDVVDLLGELTETCIQLLDVTTAGILLADQQGTLRVVASSDEPTRLLELRQVEHYAGPCLDCYASGQMIEVPDLAEENERWSDFAPVAVASGFRSVCAVPLRLRDETIGAVNLLGKQPGALSAADHQLARALADVAAIAVIQHRVIVRGEEVTAQLQGALDSRIMIEQAKGLIVERAGVGFDEAFNLLRTYARAHGERLAEVADSFINSSLTLDQLRSATVARTRKRT